MTIAQQIAMVADQLDARAVTNTPLDTTEMEELANVLRNISRWIAGDPRDARPMPVLAWSRPNDPSPSR